MGNQSRKIKRTESFLGLSKNSCEKKTRIRDCYTGHRDTRAFDIGLSST